MRKKMLDWIREIFRISLYSVITIVPVYLVSCTFRIYFKRLKYSNIPGPKTIGIRGFYLGNLKEIISLVKSGKTYPDYLYECFKEYGPVFKVQIFDRVIVHTIQPQLIKDGLVEKNYSKVPKFCKVISFPLNERFLGQGLLTETNNEIAKNRRALFQEYFQKQNLIKNFDLINDKVDILVNRLNNLADGKTYFEIKTEISHTVLEIIAKLAFSMELNSLSDCENNFKSSIRFTLEGIIEQIKDPFLCFKPSKWSYIRKFKQAIHFLRNTGRCLIRERIRMIENNQQVPEDLLSVIIESRKDNVEQMIDDFMTLFIAGQETTSIAVAFYIMELGRNKNILEKLRLEINEKIGNKKRLDYNDIQSLNYAEYVLRETLRLWPPVPTITRLMPEKKMINNYLIPKNTEIAFSVFSAGRCDYFYSDPLEFKPERFTQNSDLIENNIPSCVYFPFSLGSRGCIAQHFAKIEVKLIITKIIQNFHFELDPNQSFDCIYTGNLTPKSGVRCRIIKKI